MPKLYQDEHIDREALLHASSKATMLADLFCAAGFGQDLAFSERGLLGLTLVLREIATTMDDAKTRLQHVGSISIGERPH